MYAGACNAYFKILFAVILNYYAPVINIFSEKTCQFYAYKTT